ncbi:MAG: 50S ribosomal protein L29 [Candidatus Pacearchaeota archaeon]|jgi:ribosomal protein L29
MAVLKKKEIKKMSEKENNEKVKELRLELIKNQISSGKGRKLKTNEIKKTIARLLTFNRLKEDSKNLQIKKSVEK